MVAMLTRDIVVFVGEETTAGTTATNMRPLRIEGAAMPLAELAREMLPNERSSIYQHDNAAMVQGLERRAPVKIPMTLKYAPSQLNSASSAPTATTSSTALSQEVLLKHWLGGRVASQGSAVAGSSSTTSTVDVTTGHGSRFTVGQMVVVYVAGVPNLRKVTAISTDTLSVWPNLSAAPAAAQLVLGSRTYYRAEAMTSTLTVEAANVESGTPAAQQRGRMVRGQCAMTMEIGARVGLAFDGMAQAFDEGNLSITYADVADDMGDDVVWSGASYVFPSSDSSDPTHTCIEKMTVTCPNGWREQACMSGVEGAAGVVMTGGRSPATVELTATWASSGASLTAAYDAGTTFALLAYATRGSSTSQRWAGWIAPRMAFDGRPTRVDVDGEVMVVCKFRCLADTAAAGDPLSSSSTDAERSPLSFFYA